MAASRNYWFTESRDDKRPIIFKAPTGKAEFRKKIMRNCLLTLGLVALVCALSGAWLVSRGLVIKSSLEEVRSSVPAIKTQLLENRNASQETTIRELSAAANTAKEAAADPLWRLASTVPWLGRNFSAVTEGVTSVHDVVTGAVVPLLSDSVIRELASVAFTDGVVNTDPIMEGAPKLRIAANVLKFSHERVAEINTSSLIPEIARPLDEAETELASATQSLETAADVATLVPAMLGSEDPRRYLLLVQNNAESRASGGIPGALAVLTIDGGRLSLSDQKSAGDLGMLSPALEVDPNQEAIFSSRLGNFVQDLNLTPDFPTAAETSHRMWEQKTGQRVDGVVSVDPVALSYLLDVTGPVRITTPHLLEMVSAGLPTELDGKNVVQTLLSDVYAKIEEPRFQDAYFAGVAQEAFGALSSGRGDPKALISSVMRGATEGRISLWSAVKEEQSKIERYAVSGAIAGPSIEPAQFGVYFNDGTGAKMDYYVRRTVQLIKDCPRNGYEQTSVRITSTNTAPADAASSLPPYVTGNGIYGVPPGTVQTNIVAYGPAQAHVENASLDGQRTPFAPYLHSSRPVGVVAIRLAPGETRTVDMTFGKIVQDTEPNVVVTPTVQDVKDVLLPTQSASCG